MSKGYGREVDDDRSLAGEPPVVACAQLTASRRGGPPSAEFCRLMSPSEAEAANSEPPRPCELPHHQEGCPETDPSLSLSYALEQHPPPAEPADYFTAEPQPPEKPKKNGAGVSDTLDHLASRPKRSPALERGASSSAAALAAGKLESVEVPCVTVTEERRQQCQH